MKADNCVLLFRRVISRRAKEANYDTIRYDTRGSINVRSKAAEMASLSSARHRNEKNKEKLKHYC